MPRLSNEQVKAGILHEDIDARTAAVFYFSKCHSPDPTVMPVVIQAFERYGRKGAFRYHHAIPDLAQSDETIRWAIAELKAQPRTAPGQIAIAADLHRLLAQADPRLIRPHEQEVLALPALDAKYQERIRHRLKVASWDAEALWRRLEEICEQGKDVTWVGDLPWAEANDILEVLAWAGVRNAERIMAGLRMEVEEEEISARMWMRAAMQRLAGEVRHEPAVPHLIADIHRNDELFSEECAKALTKIGTEDVVRGLREAYPEGKWHFRLYAAGLFGEIHSDAAVQACIELLAWETDGDLIDWLASALAGQFSTEGNEVVYKLLEEDEGYGDAMQSLLSSCLLTGQDFPKVAEWRREEEADRARRAEFWSQPARSRAAEKPGPSFDASPPPPPIHYPIQRDEAKVGRNDACPCGSGKKFKKCCMNKAKPY